MPRWIMMTMNGHQQHHHRSAAASVPLDLRTSSTRERGAASVKKGDSSPGALRWTATEEHVGNRKTSPVVELGGQSPGGAFHPYAASLDTGRDSILVRSPSPTSAPGSETDTSDGASSRLPFRKRPFPTAGKEIRGGSSAPHGKGGDSSVYLPGNTDSTHRPSSRVSRRATRGVDRGAPVPPRRPSEEAGQSRDGYQGILPAFSPYCHHAVYQWPLAPVPCSVPTFHLAHQTEQLLAADVALATHQDEDGDTPLHIAVVHGEEAVVGRLLHPLVLARRDPDIYNNLRQTPLHLAVITQQVGMVKTLLRAGADPGALDRNGQTALHLCCEYGQQDCLSVVLSRSSSSSSPSPSPCLETRNYEGLSALHLAVHGAHKDLARMLLDAGADINAMDIKSGQSPLMHAVECNNADMVHFLIENHCDVNSQSYSGNTALHGACGRGQLDTVWLLLKSGADSSLKNYHNDTPVMVAKNKKVTDVLRGKGFKNTRSQDQPCGSVSPHRSNVRPGSPSPKQSLGRSPTVTPHPFHGAPQSPRVPPTLSPHSQTTESLSGGQSPMDIQVREVQPEKRSSSNMTAVDIRLSQRVTSSCPFYLSPRLHSPMPGVPLRAVMPGHLYSPVAQRTHYPDNPYTLLPHSAAVLPAYQMTISDSRPASGCSDQSDISTMSVSSGDKCDS